MHARQIQELLNANGFPCGAVDEVIGRKTKAATARFQQAANTGPWLAIDGIAGVKTQAALSKLPNLSPHFTAAEMGCRHCGQAYVRRDLLAALEALRTEIGPIPVSSSYRCRQHNRAIGGASRSMHLYGFGVDVEISSRVPEVVGLRLFSGVGDRRGVVEHVDLRHLSVENLTPEATVLRPARWTYES